MFIASNTSTRLINLIDKFSISFNLIELHVSW